MDGRLLGPLLLLDGYSVGWRITDPRPHRFEVARAPADGPLVVFVVSAAALVLVVLLAGWRPVRRRRGP